MATDHDLEAPEKQPVDLPDCTVNFDPALIAHNMKRAVFQGLMELDMNNTVAVINGEVAGNFDEDADSSDYPYLDVMAVIKNDVPVLTFRTMTFGTWMTLDADLAKFDRTRPDENELFLRCATLVKAIHESPIANEDWPEGGDSDGHPCWTPFAFRKYADDGTDEETASAWAKLAELWAAASTQPI